MSARHRLIERQSQICVAKLAAAVCTAVLFAAVLAGLLTNIISSDKAAGAAVATAPTQGAVSQEGTLVAVSPHSLTARSADGFTQTYLVTPNTSAITSSGSQPMGAAPLFAINDEVVIVATIRDGAALVTAVAHRDLGHGNARPMDYGGDQGVA